MTKGATSIALLNALATEADGICLTILPVGSVLRLIIAISRDADVLRFNGRIVVVMNKSITLRAKRSNIEENECDK